jgi:CRP/FNR family cyclic AMP-dependent transcriptional regulator
MEVVGVTAAGALLEVRKGFPSRTAAARYEAMSLILAALRDHPVRHFAEGETLLAQDGRTGLLYVLIEGAVEVAKDDIPVATAAEPGAVFGDLSALLGVPHTATVRATRASSFHVVTNPRVFLEQSPVVCLHLCELLARRLDAVNKYLVDVKQQFAGHDHLGMVDGVLDTLMHRQPRPRVIPRESTLRAPEAINPRTFRVEWRIVDMATQHDVWLKAIDPSPKDRVAGKLGAGPTRPRALGRRVMNPQPAPSDLRGFAFQQRLQFSARMLPIPPWAHGDVRIAQVEAVAIHVQPLPARRPQPLGDRLIGAVAAVAVVVSGTHNQRRLLPEQAQIFLDDRDLHIGIEGRTEIEQITPDRRHIEFGHMGQQPVELFEGIVQISNEEQPHG